MGATKINIKNVKTIGTCEIKIISFVLKKNYSCWIFSDDLVDTGDTLLVKASFLNACVGKDEMGNPDEDNIMYRRRVVPFVTKVNGSKIVGKEKRNRISVNIENISEPDGKYLYRKMSPENLKKNELLEIEAKKITFAN